MPNAEAVQAFGSLPLPALIILALIIAGLGGLFIYVKFGDGKRSEPATTDFQVKLATFDPATMQMLIQEIGKSNYETERLNDGVRDLGADVRELTRTVKEVLRRQ